MADRDCSTVPETERREAQTFCVVKKRQDAIEFTQETVTKIENLKKPLNAKTSDPTAIVTGSREVGTACATCHGVYRTTDENNKFILKRRARCHRPILAVSNK
jgi:cytochrome c556